jgi:tetratricopeptide (TPR) repeat protein
MKHLYVIFICILSIGFAGCESAPISSDFMLASLEGKIFDYDNTPCSDVLITIDNGGSVRTDINGRFLLPSVGKGKHEIKATKNGYEDYVASFSFLNRNQILWIRMLSIHQLEKKIETAFDEKKWDEVESLVDRALAIDKNDPIIMYLQAMYFNENGWFEQATDVLVKIAENGYPDATVFITIADICEYKLQNKELAIQYLQKYLDIKTDEAAFKRLDNLKKSQ